MRRKWGIIGTLFASRESNKSGTILSISERQDHFVPVQQQADRGGIGNCNLIAEFIFQVVQSIQKKIPTLYYEYSQSDIY